jgi:hypothetical protein
MRGERALLRIGECLVARACRSLPPEIRDERCREWTAELPAILLDPEIKLAPHRAARMLGYAADTLRGTALASSRTRRRPLALSTALLGLLLIAGLVAMALSVWNTAQAPGRWVNYFGMAWSLFLVTWPVSQYFRFTARMTALTVIGACLAGVVVCIGNAVQAPGDWVNYLLAAWLCLLLLAWLITRWARARRAALIHRRPEP